MTHGSQCGLRGGPNVAMKVPPDQFDQTVAFYRDSLGFEVTQQGAASVRVEFGQFVLWLDKVEGVGAAELWLEIRTDDVAAADQELTKQGIGKCNEVEALPDDFRGFWIRNPAGVIHLVAEPGQDEPASPETPAAP